MSTGLDLLLSRFEHCQAVLRVTSAADTRLDVSLGTSKEGSSGGTVSQLLALELAELHSRCEALESAYDRVVSEKGLLHEKLIAAVRRLDGGGETRSLMVSARPSAVSSASGADIISDIVASINADTRDSSVLANRPLDTKLDRFVPWLSVPLSFCAQPFALRFPQV